MGGHETGCVLSPSICRQPAPAAPQRSTAASGSSRRSSRSVPKASPPSHRPPPACGFFQDILRISAPLSSPDVGHNTVAAEVIAAKHDVYSRFKAYFRSIGRFSTIWSVSFQMSTIIRSDSMAYVTSSASGYMLWVPKDQVHKPVALFQFFHHLPSPASCSRRGRSSCGDVFFFWAWR